MADKSKIAELDKAIKSKRAELDKARQEKAAAENDASRLVLAEKHERRLAGQLQALEQAKAAAEYVPPEPSDREELLKPLQRYYDNKATKERKAAEAVQATERELVAVKLGLRKATEDCDAEKTVVLSEKRDELESRLKHLLEMQKRVNTLPVFPAGAIEKEWAAICKKTLPDWNNLAMQVEALAAEYETACAALLQMRSTLKSVRDELGHMAEQDGQGRPMFPQTLTAGMNGSRLTVSREYHTTRAQLLSIAEKPFGEQAL